jgi:opacity protein-like surface antigen
MIASPRRPLAAPFALALAAATVAPAAASDWTGGVTLYGWVPTLSGDQSGDEGGGRLSVDYDAGSVLEALDFAAMGFAEARRGRFGLFLDVVFADLESDATVSAGFGGRGADADAAVETLLLTGGASWRLFDGERASLDGFGALRYAAAEASFTVDDDAPVLGGRGVSADADWVDPMVGLRGRVALTESLTLAGFGDIGGFGVGSELSWDAYAGIDWGFAANWRAGLGYRATAIDYDDDGLTLDLVAHGPMVGLGWRF